MKLARKKGTSSMASLNDLQKKLKKTPAPAKSEAAVPQSQGREITGYTMEECIEKAENLFQVSSNYLRFDIIEKGSKGLLGVGKKLFKVKFFVSDSEVVEDDAYSYGDETERVVQPDTTAPVNGEVRIMIRKTGVFLRVKPALNEGEPVTQDDVLMKLAAKSYRDYDAKEIRKIISESKGEYLKIGEYYPSPDYDSRADIEISEDEMKAYLTVSAPTLSGRILEDYEIEQLIESRGIIFGVKKERIKEIMEEERFNVPIIIAEGIQPENGQDSEIDFHFKIDTEIQIQEDESGKVDYFSDFGLIQNVVAGQILAVKNPPTNGKPGKTIAGNDVEAKNGEDIEFVAGKNAALSDNALEIIAQSPGRAVYKEQTIEVEPIYEVKGNVGVKTGNVTFLGDVIVSGNVEDGFSIKAAGNVHIGGTIGKAIVEADGDVVVNRGILGKEEGYVKAGGNVFAKFIENSRISAGGKVIAKEGILHSTVDAKSVYSLGKRGVITGGHIRTVEEINAKTIGSTSYTETKVEAGVDPVAKEKLLKFEKEKEEIEENLSKLIPNLTTIQNQKKAMKTLSPDREVMLQRMLQAKKELDIQLKEINIDIDELKNYLSSLSTQGKISAKDKVYPGTDVTLKNALLKVKTDYTFVTFTIDGGEVRNNPYQEVRSQQNNQQQDGKKTKTGKKEQDSQ